jgi:nucleotide-binding universal stress UspA family protein
MTTLQQIYTEAEAVGYPITDAEANEIVSLVDTGIPIGTAIDEHARQWFEMQEADA